MDHPDDKNPNPMSPVAADNAEARSESEAKESPANSKEESGLRSRLEQLVPDLFKRTLYAGLGAVFSTEEGIRKLAADFQLPKDITNYLIQSAGASKDELMRIVASELHSFLQNVNVSGELQKLLTSLSFEIKTEIRFIPNSESSAGVKPEVKVGRLSLRRNRLQRDKASKEKK